MSRPWPRPNPETVRNALAEGGLELLPERVAQWIDWIPRQTAMLVNFNAKHSALRSPYVWAQMVRCAHEQSPVGPGGLENNIIGQALAAAVYGVLEHIINTSGELDDLAQELAEDDETIFLSLAVYARATTAFTAILAGTPELGAACIYTLTGDSSNLVLNQQPKDHPVVAELLDLYDDVRHALSLAVPAALELRTTAGDIELPHVLVRRYSDLLNSYVELDMQELIEFVPLRAFGGEHAGQFSDDCMAIASELDEAIGAQIF